MTAAMEEEREKKYSNRQVLNCHFLQNRSISNIDRTYYCHKIIQSCLSITYLGESTHNSLTSSQIPYLPLRLMISAFPLSFKLNFLKFYFSTFSEYFVIKMVKNFLIWKNLN